MFSKLKFLSIALAVCGFLPGLRLLADPQVWQIGVDDPAGPGGANELSPENSVNDAAPGRVTRISGDPLFNSASNPTADDDFYLQGTFPSGFNGLTAALSVPNSEPAIAWENSLTKSDLTNRIHFVLNASQVSAGSMLRLSFDLYTGGKVVSGVNQGFGEHDIVVRFKNASGTGTQMYASTITAPTSVSIIIPTANVAASAGPNSIEIIRTGPMTAGISYWTTFDYVRLEVDAGGNTDPVPVVVATQTIPEMVAFSMNLSTTDSDTPNSGMLYTRLSGPTGLTVSTNGVVSWTPTEDQGPSTNVVVVRVTDAGIPRKSATNQFTLVVSEVNRPPTTTAVSTQTLNELTSLAITLASADPDLPANARTFARISGPDGLTVTGGGQVAWTPREDQGPSTNSVSVRVSDNGVPPLFATNNFVVIVREVNSPPVPVPVPPQSVDEQTLFTLTLTTNDGDIPPNPLLYTFLSGPTGLTVSAGGVVNWTPTETQGPGTSSVTVRVSDTRTPALLATNVFTITVREVNRAPVLTAIPIQYVDELSPLDFDLSATDPDIPANGLTFSRIAGPTGLTVSSQGRVLWTPTPSQIPSTNTVTVRVDDNGTPSLSDTITFTVITRTAAARYLWQIGSETTPPSIAEFGPQNNRNDPPPGSVTRIPGDPQYNAGTNPGPDDDFYFSGIYRAGFNQLQSLITVPNDEPPAAWESTLTHGDRTNRMHFLLSQSQLTSASRLRLSFEFAYGGAILNGVNQGFGSHDVVVRFRNGDGVSTDLRVTTLTAATNITFLINPVSVQATLGANSIEFVRTGPNLTGYTYYLHFDYVRLEADPSGNLAPVPVAVGTQTVDELTPFTLTLQTTDSDVPAQTFTYSLLSGPSGVAVTPGGIVAWTPTEAQGPSTNVVSIRVTDSGSPPKSATNTFSIVVRELNIAPVPVTVSPQSINEMAPWTLTLQSNDPDIPANQLTYAKISGPANLAVSTAGVLTWTSTEAEGPSSYPVSVRITDDGTPARIATNAFTLNVDEVNRSPVLTSLPTQTIFKNILFQLTIPGSDPDVPLNGLTFEKLAGPTNLTISPAGLLSWIPNDSQGPSLNTVTVSLTDDGEPSRSTTNSFNILVIESNSSLPWTPFPDPTVDELTELSLNLVAIDPANPTNPITYDLLSGPPGMTVSSAGLLRWTPTENQGPSTQDIVVRARVTSDPLISSTHQFTVTVNEVNRPPQLAAVATQNITSTTSLSLNLSASDPDSPSNTLTFGAVQVPPGLTVSAAGAVQWTPGSAQIPSVNVVKVRVTDNGVPALSHTNQFTVNVTGTAPRFIWRVGTNDNPGTFAELGQENSKNDLPPGLVTRLPGDPLYVALNNPTPDDDHYLAGTYPSGFNGLTSSLVVPNDEPWSAFERSLVPADRTNRIHFILNSSQVAANSVFRLSFEFHTGGSVAGPFGTHDIVVRFRNASGVATQVYANQLTAAANVVLQFSLNSVAASAGPNTIEFVRNGVNISANYQWINFDYVMLEVDAGGNLAPVFPNLGVVEVDEGSPVNLDLSARDGDTPTAQLIHAMLAGPAGSTLTPGGQFSWITSETHGGTSYQVRVKATDNGIPALSSTNDVTIVVREVNQTPEIAPVSSVTVDPLTLLALQLGGSDPDIPTNTLIYRLIDGPVGLIVSAGGKVSWTPASADIPSTNTVVVGITDDGIPPLSATTQFTVKAVPVVDRNLWQIGDDDSPLTQPYAPAAEFGTPTSNSANDPRPGKVTRLPADPEFLPPTPTRDDDYYFAGIYPPGFNGLTNYLNVPFDEPTSSWEAVLTQADRTNRMHFRLNGDQINDSGQLRLSFEFSSVTATTNGATVTGVFPHNIVVQFKSGLGQPTLLYSNTITQPTRVTLEIPATNLVATLGANTIEFVRTGPTFPGTTQTVTFDYVRLEADSQGNLDADGDGLPQNWEIDNHLSDSDPSDAAQDLDRDGLTALQEYHGGINATNPRKPDTDDDGLTDAEERALGSNPLLADTDHDGVSDLIEVRGTPATSPLLADSDNDGFSDLLEQRYGSNPNNASQKPTRFRGGIGINFFSSFDLLGVLGTNGLAGVVPQTLWNETVPMAVGAKPSGGMTDIATPVAGQLVRSDGTNLPNLKIKWTSNSSSATHNNGSGDQVLMNGFLRASSSVPVVLTVSNVPFASYDVYVYVGGATDAHQGVVRLGTDPVTDRFFQARSTAPQSEWLEALPGADRDRPANYVRYSGLTSPDFTVTVTSLLGQALGIHAIQIVDRLLDSDLSGIPDWWELRYALEPGSTALAAADSDADGLSNLQEFQRGSDPRIPDTDLDGLPDGQETAANALRYDSDNDGVSDGDEKGSIYVTNPNSGDSDGDGVGDWLEDFYFTDPTYRESSSPSFTGWTPKYKATPPTWEWNLENIQLVWDHGVGALYPDQFNDNDLVAFSVRNSTFAELRTFSMNLRYYKGLLSYYFSAYPGGGMSGPSTPTTALIDAPIGGRVQDLTPELGFSGYGSADVSDRLQLRMLATRGTGNSWTLSFELRNQTRNISLIKRTFLNCTAAPSVDAGTAVWGNSAGVTGRVSMDVHSGVQLFFSPTPLENRPQFAATRDTDNDGISDVWEDAHGMNDLLASDALKDLDRDGLNSREEYLFGTDPLRPDSDGDGIPDGVERANGSNPADAISVPQYTRFPTLSGEDLNGDGLPDVWQIHYHGFGLTPNGDPDGDGQSNAQEALWGTNPFDSASKIALTLEVVNSSIKLSWPNQDFKNQTLLWKTGSNPWVAYSGQPWTDGGISWLVLSNRVALAPNELYRVDTEDLDADGDGVTDWAESILGTDPYRNNSSRSPVRIVSAGGKVTGSIAGDYATFVDQVRTGASFGAHQMPRLQAARFLQQASFGPTPSELDRVQELGFAAWIDDQIAGRPPSLHSPYIEEIVRDFYGPRNDIEAYRSNTNINVVLANNVNTSFARAVIGGPDQLRQRVAFALSQILVISRRNADIQDSPLAVTSYYDIFVRNAFSNYFNILREVTLHPAMGMYLSAIGNQKAIPEINQYPDENYAREVQQLFSIGLWELNQDGSQILNSLGKPILTYGNREITEFARVFTGFWFGGQTWGVGGVGGFQDNDTIVPMELWVDKHDFGEKTLLRGFRIPARSPSVQNGFKDVDDALRSLLEHPNTAPFIGKQLIQFLVTSNPSSNYVSRISAVFANDGSGQRGNLGAVVKAILLDPEARDPQWSATGVEYGRLKEPVYRAINLARVGNLGRHPGLLWWTPGAVDFYAAGLQEPTLAPTVFNFYRPNYQPPGIMAQRNLVGPAFQITDSYTSISFPNKLWEITEKGFITTRYAFEPDYTELMRLADDAEALLDEVNLLICGGGMSADTRRNILEALEQVAPYDRILRTQLAVYLAVSCPDGAVQR